MEKNITALKSGLLKYKHTYAALFKLGLPVLVTQLGNIVVSMADTMMVGAYGTQELASAAFVNNLYMIPIVMQMGFAGGVTPLIGALFGSKKHYDAGAMLRVGIKLNLILAMFVLLVMGTLYFFLPYMGQPPELMPLIQSYYLIVLVSVIFASLFYPCMQMALGITDTVSPMILIICANVLNCAGNYILIFGHFGMPELGLDGAGLSTMFARILCTAGMLAVVLFGSRYRPYREGLKKRGGMPGQRRQMIRTSVPVMIQSGIECSLWGLGAVVCGWYGKEQLAAYQVVLVMGQLGFMTYMSFATATSIRIANLSGISDKTNIRTTAVAGLHMNLALASVASLTFFILGEHILGLFTGDKAVTTIGVTLILPLILYQFADAVQMTYVNALRGTSKVKPLINISIISYLAIGIPAMLLLASVLALKSVGVYYSFSTALIVAAVLYRKAFIKTLQN